VTPFESWAWLSNKRELQRQSQNKRVSKTSKNSRIKRELQRLQRLSNKKRVSKDFKQRLSNKRELQRLQRCLLLKLSQALSFAPNKEGYQPTGQNCCHPN
jgi:hypothetical protein